MSRCPHYFGHVVYLKNIFDPLFQLALRPAHHRSRQCAMRQGHAGQALPNPADAMPIVRRPMCLPVAARTQSLVAQLAPWTTAPPGRPPHVEHFWYSITMIGASDATDVMDSGDNEIVDTPGGFVWLVRWLAVWCIISGVWSKLSIWSAYLSTYFPCMWPVIILHDVAVSTLVRFWSCLPCVGFFKGLWYRLC